MVYELFEELVYKQALKGSSFDLSSVHLPTYNNMTTAVWHRHIKVYIIQIRL